MDKNREEAMKMIAEADGFIFVAFKSDGGTSSGIIGTIDYHGTMKSLEIMRRQVVDAARAKVRGKGGAKGAYIAGVKESPPRP